MMFLLILGLIWSGTLTLVYLVSTTVNAWKGRGWAQRLMVLMLVSFVDIVLLDALNWIPGVF